MNRRALLIAAAFAAIAVVLLMLYLRRYEQEVSGGAKVQVLTVIKPMKRGDRITKENVSVSAVPVAYVEDRAIRAAELPKIEGLRVGNRLQSLQTLMWTDLSIASDEETDLSSLVEAGRRAFTVQAENRDKSMKLIRPGDYVDVIANLGDGESQHSVVLLQRVMVLAVGLETRPHRIEDGKKQAGVGDLMLTLSVTLREAQMLTLGVQNGTISVALRNPDDTRVDSDVTDMPASILSKPAARAAVRGVPAEDPNMPVRLGGTK